MLSAQHGENRTRFGRLLDTHLEANSRHDGHQWHERIVENRTVCHRPVPYHQGVPNTVVSVRAEVRGGHVSALKSATRPHVGLNDPPMTPPCMTPRLPGSTHPGFVLYHGAERGGTRPRSDTDADSSTRGSWGGYEKSSSFPLCSTLGVVWPETQNASLTEVRRAGFLPSPRLAFCVVCFT